MSRDHRSMSDTELENLLRRAANPAGAPAPLDPERARAIFERALSLSGVESGANLAAAPAAAGWWERLRSTFAAPRPTALGAFAVLGVAAVLVAVAVTPPDRKGGGDVADNRPVARPARVPTPVPSSTPSADAVARLAAADIPKGGSGAAGAVPQYVSAPAESGGRAKRSGGGKRPKGDRRRGNNAAPVRKSFEAAPKDARPVLLPDDEPILMVASNLPGGHDEDRLLVSVRENVPAELPGYAEASALREMPVGPAGPAGLPGLEGPAGPQRAGEGEVTLVWAESVVESGEEPRLEVIPVAEPLPAPLPEPDPLPEPVPESIPEP